jgi:hypothetical protein
MFHQFSSHLLNMEGNEQNFLKAKKKKRAEIYLINHLDLTIILLFNFNFISSPQLLFEP